MQKHQCKTCRGVNLVYRQIVCGHKLYICPACMLYFVQVINEFYNINELYGVNRELAQKIMKELN